MENKQIQGNGHLFLVPLPYQGHINPMFQLAKALHSRGFDITIAHTIYNSPDPQNHPHFAFLPLPDGLADGDHAVGDLVDNILAISERCAETFRRHLDEVLVTTNISCVVSDELMFFAEDVARDLNLPSAILRTTSAATSFARSRLIELTERGRIPSKGLVSHDLVPEIPPLRIKDLPITDSVNLGRFAVLISKAYKSRTSSAIIWNTVDCLEHSTLEEIRQQCQASIFAIGPIHMISPLVSSSLIKEDKTCLSWLDKQPDNSVIYISSSGSIASFTHQQVSEIALGLANSRQRFLWVIRPGSVQGSDWIEWFPEGFDSVVAERGCVVKWAPQKEVLAHNSVGGFWSHCGWNSSLESLAKGVPMICRPCFGDQKVNARYVSHVWRVGLELEELERGEIEKAIRRLISGNEGNEMRDRAKELKEKFEASTKKGGSSYESLNQLVNFIVSHPTSHTINSFN